MRKRNHQFHVRMNDKEYAKFIAKVERSGLTRSGYIRQLLANLNPRDIPPPDFRPMMRQFYVCGNMLNEVAQKAHALDVIDEQKYDEAIQIFHDTVEQVYAVIKR